MFCVLSVRFLMVYCSLFKRSGRRLFLSVITLFPVLCCFSQEKVPAGVVSGRFGKALDARTLSASAPGHSLYKARPLTIECRARVDSRNGFQILLANEMKASATHWELYTYAHSGVFSLYMPANSPAEIKSTRNITDGKWHYLAAVLDGKRIRLYVDGLQVADVKESMSGRLNVKEGDLAFGRLVERSIGCDGAIDEVRISNCSRPIGQAPEAPFQADRFTVGLWHFDAVEKDGSTFFSDASHLSHHAVCTPPVSAAPRPGAPLSPRFAPPVLPPVAETKTEFRNALSELPLATLTSRPSIRDAVLRDWEELWYHLDRRCRGIEQPPKGAASQAFDRHALVHGSDGDPLGVVLRRTEALLSHLLTFYSSPSLTALERDLLLLKRKAASVPLTEKIERKRFFLAACALQRQFAFANPLLDFDCILFVARGVRAGSRKTGPRTTSDRQGQHFATQYFGFNALPGGGLFVVKEFKTQPQVINLLENSVVENGRLAGKHLDFGAFLSPDLSFDGSQVLFSWVRPAKHEYVWTRDTTWSIFSVTIDGTGLRQLTDERWDDFDACWLPGGRIAFISERRGGYIRCFSGLPVPQHSLHTMLPDGSDITPISFFETSEWHPSADNNGMLIYTRWDYVDRENCLGSNFWICAPDGRNPRAPHGNYPYPWHTFKDNRARDSRIGRPYTEMNIRAIPGSHRYIFTAAPHHGESFGSICMLDLDTASDDGFMSQIRRITPYVPFPESETPARGQYPYGTAWPLSQDFYLCTWWENLYLLDRFGNRVLLCENELVFSGVKNWEFRLIDPIPVKPGTMPPVVPHQTAQEPYPHTGGTGMIAVMNIYDTDLPFPPGTTIKWLRVTQNILKPNPEMGQPMIGYQNEACPRIPLGVVPVESDGSCHFEAPAGKELIFQALDENFMAVQSMRSVTYVHAGEKLVCAGCHEDPQTSPDVKRFPLALRRPPSKLQPETGQVEPVTYYRLVKPVFEKSCIPCHRTEGKGPVDMSYRAVKPYTFHFDGGMRGTTVKAVHGGSRTISGRFGARASRMGRALLDRSHRGVIDPLDYRRVVLWLDSNSLRLGAFHNEEAQIKGEVVWPNLDTKH